MTVSSEVDICNLALDHLNQSAIQSIEVPTTDLEELCARWYDTTRRMALRKHAWNFAVKRAELAPDATPPLFGFSKAFSLPADYIRVMHLNESVTISENPISSKAYRVEGGKILIGNFTAPIAGDPDQVNIVYVSDFKTVPQFDPSFIDYFATMLAFRMAYKVTNSNTSVDRMRTLMTEAESSARSMDGQETPPIRVQRSRNRRSRRNVGSISNLDGVVVFNR